MTWRGSILVWLEHVIHTKRCLVMNVILNIVYLLEENLVSFCFFCFFCCPMQTHKNRRDVQTWGKKRKAGKEFVCSPLIRHGKKKSLFLSLSQVNGDRSWPSSSFFDKARTKLSFVINPCSLQWQELMKCLSNSIDSNSFPFPPNIRRTY